MPLILKRDLKKIINFSVALWLQKVIKSKRIDGINVKPSYKRKSSLTIDIAEIRVCILGYCLRKVPMTGW